VIATALRAARLAALEPKIVMPFVASSGPRYFPGSPLQETLLLPASGRATDGRHRALAACCTASASCASEEDGATRLDKRPFRRAAILSKNQSGERALEGIHSLVSVRNSSRAEKSLKRELR
jgi:hypothetical protein